MNINYAWEKLHGAVHSLVGTSSIKQRLIAAYEILVFLPEEDIPVELKDEFSEIMNFVKTVNPKGDKGKIKTAVYRISDVEAGYMAKKILGIYDSITRKMN